MVDAGEPLLLFPNLSYIQGTDIPEMPQLLWESFAAEVYWSMQKTFNGRDLAEPGVCCKNGQMQLNW